VNRRITAVQDGPGNPPDYRHILRFRLPPKNYRHNGLPRKNYRHILRYRLPPKKIRHAALSPSSLPPYSGITANRQSITAIFCVTVYRLKITVISRTVPAMSVIFRVPVCRRKITVIMGYRQNITAILGYRQNVPAIYAHVRHTSATL